MKIADYQDYKNVPNQELPELDETICQACGANLEITSENVGFDAPNPTLIELDCVCPNGCLQDENVVII